MSNLDLWEKHFKTDPAYVKEVRYGGRHFETVDAYYRIQIGTDLWGPYGNKWGLKDQEIKIINDVVLYKATFFCPETEFTIYNDVRVGSDFAKKVETDTLTKAMSKLGICGDVYQGKHADSKYVTELREEIYTENKRAILKYQMEKHKDSIDAIKTGIATGDLSGAVEAYVELGLNNIEQFEEVKPLWIAPTTAQKKLNMEGPFTTKERDVMKGTEFSELVSEYVRGMNDG